MKEIDLKDKMQESYLDYSKEVIIQRAIPDLRDGLKPVHRRILFGAKDMGVTSNGMFVKSAKIVGHVMGEFHPHGDAAIYDAAAILAQDFKTRYPLLSGQGNYGSIDGDKQAASRYTEMKLSRLGEILLDGVNEKIVEFRPNYNDEKQEPCVLTSKLPNLLMNGAEGVAVGISTKLPSHNVVELVNGIEQIVKNPNITNKELMTYIKGPDFPTGGIVRDTDGIQEYFETGKGKFNIESKWKLTRTNLNDIITINEIPYGTKKAKIVSDIASYIGSDEVPELIDVEDHSNMSGISIEITLEKNSNIERVYDFLSSKCSLTRSFSVNNYTINHDEHPVILGMKESLLMYLDFQKLVYKNQLNVELEKNERKLKIANALIKASKNIREILDLIEKSESEQKLIKQIKKTLDVDDESANYILSMQIKRLQKIETKKQLEDIKTTKAKIKEIKNILISEKNLLEYIVNTMKKLALEVDDGRKTQITTKEQTIEIDDKNDIIIYSNSKVITLPETYQLKAAEMKEFKGGFKSPASIDSLVILKNGRAKLIKTSQGENLTYNIEDIAGVIPLVMDKEYSLYVCTNKAMIKALNMELITKEAYKKDEFAVIGMIEGEEVVNAFLANPKDNIIAYNNNDKYILTTTDDIREMGLSARGVVLIKTPDTNKLVGAFRTNGFSNLLFMNKTEEDSVKIEAISPQNRGGLGRNMKKHDSIIAYNFKKDILGQDNKFVLESY